MGQQFYVAAGLVSERTGQSCKTAARMGFMVNRLEGRLNARVSKSFLKDDALTLSLTADDILRTGYYHFNVYGIDSYNGNRIYRDWQRVGIQLSYKFNATKSKYKGTGAGQSEKARSVGCTGSAYSLRMISSKSASIPVFRSKSQSVRLRS